MAWTAPRTWVVGEVLTAALANTHIRDNLLGFDFDSTTNTADVTVTSTSAVTPDTLVTGGAITFDGSTAVFIEYFSAQIVPGTTWIQIRLWEGASEIGILSEHRAQAPCFARLKRVPTSGSKTYAAKAHVDAGSGTVRGASPYTPMVLTVRKT